MEYFLGSAITFAILYITNRFVAKDASYAVSNRVLKPFTQSQKNEILVAHLGFQPVAISRVVQETQAMKHFMKNGTIRVVLSNDKAYWIHNSNLLVADLIGGNIDKENAKVVDTIGMDKVELDKVIFIVEELTKGANNDNGNSGNKKLF